MNAPLSAKQIEYWPLAQLKPYAATQKPTTPNQVAKIAASMAEFGWTVPVLVADDGELIAGHGRILAAAHWVEERRGRASGRQCQPYREHA